MDQILSVKINNVKNTKFKGLGTKELAPILNLDFLRLTVTKVLQNLSLEEFRKSLK